MLIEIENVIVKHFRHSEDNLRYCSKDILELFKNNSINLNDSLRNKDKVIDKLRIELEIYQIRFHIEKSSCNEYSTIGGLIKHVPEHCNLCLLHAKEMGLSKKLKILNTEK